MRLFIGLELPEHIRRAVSRQAERLAVSIPGRYAPEQSYHITLAFLGDCDAAASEKAQAAMRETAAGARPFPLHLTSPGHFGRQSNAVLYLGADSCPALDDLAWRLRSALSAYRLPYDEKPFRAHVTIARRSQIGQDLPPTLSAEIPPFPIQGLTLFQSVRADGLPVYLPLARAPFPRAPG